MKKLIIFLSISLLCLPAFGAVTKTGGVLDSWQGVAQNTVVKGTEANISANYQSVLTVAGVLNTTTATTNGLLIQVEVSPVLTQNDTWYTLTEFSALSGVTAGILNATVTTTAGNNTINATLTTGFAGKGLWVFLQNLTTTANSELVRFISNNTGAATLLTPVEQTQVANFSMSNQSFLQTITLPDAIQRVRIVYNNTGDASGSAAVVTSSISNITGI